MRRCQPLEITRIESSCTSNIVPLSHCSSYDQATCGGEVSHFSAIKNDFCIPLSATTSFIFTFPNISIFIASANCTSEPLLLEQMGTDCQAAEDFADHDDYDDDGYGTTTLSYRVTLYTGHSDAPSPRPTAAPQPTAAPSANNLVYFSASQVILDRVQLLINVDF